MGTIWQDVRFGFRMLMKHRLVVRAGMLLSVLKAYLVALVPTAAMLAGLVLAIEIIVRHTVNATGGPNINMFGMSLNSASPTVWLLSVGLVLAGYAIAHRTWAYVAHAWDHAATIAREKGYLA